MSRRLDRKFRATITEIEQTAKQVKVLEEIHQNLLEHLSPSPHFSIIHFDTVLYQLYNNEQFHYSWATAGFQNWLARNEQIILEQKQSRVFRYIFVPTVESISNAWSRHNLTDVVVFNLHLNMWFGVVVGVVFIDTRKCPPTNFTRLLNTSYIPLDKMCFGSSEFYQGKDIRFSIKSGCDTESHIEAISTLVRSSPYRPIWLWYDEANYSRQRLIGVRWEALRKLFYALSEKPFRCPVCKESKSSEYTLDHILPIADGHHQTLLNFMGICGNCNRLKGDKRGRYDPFGFPQFIPEVHRTVALQSVLTKPPGWLGNIARPLNRTEIQQLVVLD
jgi:5-methylcytosine-specific restriction endonuclease McrA